MKTATKSRTLVELLRERTAELGSRQAYAFLVDGEREGETLGYAALDARARALATGLRARLPRGARVMLGYPPGLDFVAAFFGSLYAGLIAVPVAAPHPRRGRERLEAIASDCGASALLTSRSGAAATALAGLPVMATDALEVADAEAGEPSEADLEGIAFLQYTSGSTSAPRGVKVSHANLLSNLAAIARAEANGRDSRGLSWLPVHHDMGLIEGVLQPLYCGYPAWLLSPAAFLQRPARWLEAISRVRATVSGGPNFAYELCARRVADAELCGLDLSSWRVAYNGSEPVRADTLAAFAARFAACGFRASALRPVYGLAEATLLVSAAARGRRAPKTGYFEKDALAAGEVRPARAGAPGCTELVSCGRPVARTEVVIADPDGRGERDGIGEICVSGPGVASGYWGGADARNRSFRRSPGGAGRLLHTGDLGFLHRGELFVTGRIKDLIILRGRKIHPQDIERCVQASHPQICAGGVAVFALPSPEGDAVAVAAEIERPGRAAAPAWQTVFDAIAAEVFRGHEVAVAAIALLRRGALPRTTSGKLMRFRCREDLLAGRLAELARWQLPEARIPDDSRSGAA